MFFMNQEQSEYNRSVKSNKQFLLTLGFNNYVLWPNVYPILIIKNNQ